MKKLILLACVGLVMLSGSAHAEGLHLSEEIEMLRRTVEDQNRIISDLLRRIEALESKQGVQEEWIETKKEKLEWPERVRVKGDFRYRYEYIDDDRKDDDRNRNRMRARIGAEAKVTDSLDLGFRLSTAEVVDANGKSEGNPTSGNQTLTDAWSFKNIWLEQAYFDWHPARVPGFSVIGGKMHRPFYTPGKNELLWDADLVPEGGVIKYEKSFDPFELFARGYGFWVIERGSEGDSSLWGAQTGLEYNFSAWEDKAHVLGGLSYYDYGNVEGEAPFVDGSSFGNTTVGGVFAEDYNLFEVFGEFGFKAKEKPVLLFADFVENTAADDEENGWLVGFKVGKAKKPGTWDFRYIYRELEKDAVFGTFVDSDFGNGGTDAEGHEFNLSYALANNWTLAASYFLNDVDVAPGEEEEDYERLQLDLKFKF